MEPTPLQKNLAEMQREISKLDAILVDIAYINSRRNRERMEVQMQAIKAAVDNMEKSPEWMESEVQAMKAAVNARFKAECREV